MQIALNRSFARRIGKTLSPVQKNLLEDSLPRHLYSTQSLENISKDKEIFLEIGFGMGEHFITQASLKPDALFIGVEAYLNGVANVLKLASEQGVTNFLLWPDDLDLILENFPVRTLSGIYILFPDPWPKRKQQKKRLFNKERLNLLQDKLKERSLLIFASDIADYFVASKDLIINAGSFSLQDENFAEPHASYITTKYHQKAEGAGRIPKFLRAIYR